MLDLTSYLKKNPHALWKIKRFHIRTYQKVILESLYLQAKNVDLNI